MIPRAALWTPAGRGAIATIRVSDLPCSPPERLSKIDSLFSAACGVPLASLPHDRVAFGRWGDDPPEDVVVCRTTNDQFEIHCHGGSAAAGRILLDLQSAGVRVVSWQALLEATRGAFSREGTDALARAPTVRCAEILNDQVGVTFASAVERLIESPALSDIDVLLGWAEFGRHLIDPWQVVLTGRPNVGKSSLANALLGYGRAIVSATPGTTRDVVTAETAFDGWPVRLADTAGIRETSVAVEADGIARARQSLQGADLVIVVLDGSEPLTPDDRELLREWPKALVAVNKSDLGRDWTDPPGLPVSCVTGHGVENLAAAIARRLVPCLPPHGIGIPFSPRQVRLLESAGEAVAANDHDLASSLFRRILSAEPGELPEIGSETFQTLPL